MSASRFVAPLRVSARRARGPVDQELVLDQEEEGLSVSVWRPSDGGITRVLQLDGGLEGAVLNADGSEVLVLADDNGSEQGHVWAYPVDGSPPRDLTPDLGEYALRGIDSAVNGSATVIAPAGEDGFSLWLLPSDGPNRQLFNSEHEAWNSRISADGSTACIDTTDHNPGLRRFAVTAFDVESGTALGVLTDGPSEPVRVVRFSAVLGDNRILVSTEKSGFARPAIWNPHTGERIDVEAAELAGDLVALDWSDDASLVLAVHVDEGIHRLYEYSVAEAELRRLPHPDGAYFHPDVASALPMVWTSHYGSGNDLRLLHQRFDQPLGVCTLDRVTGQFAETLLSPAVVPAGTPATSRLVTAPDGTKSQLWSIRSPMTDGPAPLILNIHGGPNLVSVDEYSPEAQAWLDEGFAFASLNYRGSVTFGRKFREAFWGAVGDGELTDVRAAVEALIADGTAAPGQIFITGLSYGGFMTLLSLGRLPDLFAGGFAVVALADWRIAYEDMSPALQAAWRSFMGGDPSRLPEAFIHSSPITYVEHVRAPVLLLQGTTDTRTPPRQAQGYADALAAIGGDVRLDWFDGGHETTSVASSIADHALMVSLARKALAGERWSH